MVISKDYLASVVDPVQYLMAVNEAICTTMNRLFLVTSDQARSDSKQRLAWSRVEVQLKVLKVIVTSIHFTRSESIGELAKKTNELFRNDLFLLTRLDEIKKLFPARIPEDYSILMQWVAMQAAFLRQNMSWLLLYEPDKASKLAQIEKVYSASVRPRK